VAVKIRIVVVRVINPYSLVKCLATYRRDLSLPSSGYEKCRITNKLDAFVLFVTESLKLNGVVKYVLRDMW
jgi:hypothetical protein